MKKLNLYTHKYTQTKAFLCERMTNNWNSLFYSNRSLIISFVIETDAFSSVYWSQTFGPHCFFFTDRGHCIVCLGVVVNLQSEIWLTLGLCFHSNNTTDVSFYLRNSRACSVDYFNIKMHWMIAETYLCPLIILSCCAIIRRGCNLLYISIKSTLLWLVNDWCVPRNIMQWFKYKK